ncbi:triphosphoribosyl-dephospho-CoA synthase [Rhodococcus daqingensis]|uniref:triphosphoribosyl-dephospho-CoA synthase n=1 Tax=Rhodococcus daqingensis TaxID=2479363 RepID=A0ABW2RW80_9NOCA
MNVVVAAPLRSEALAAHAVGALLDEVELTPKPGLVDRRGGGTHTDMTLTLMRRSAHALYRGFVEMARTAAEHLLPDQNLRVQLAAIGRRTEADMYEATGGVNTHRGAIWALGLLTASAALLPEGSSAEDLARTAGLIARHPDPGCPAKALLSHGSRARAQYGVPGARGQAQAGFPHLIDLALPTLRRSRAARVSEVCARLDTLVALMAELDDTCVLHRGGVHALEAVRDGASRVLTVGGTGTAAGRARLSQLDRTIASLGVSPGGAADLLAATLLLDRIAPAGSIRAQHVSPAMTKEASWRN